MTIAHSEYVSPASPRLLRRYGHPVDEEGCNSDTVEEASAGTTPATGLFKSFPRTLVIVGDAERSQKEVKSLVGAMTRDSVNVQTEWVKDAVHDILIMADGWWDEDARQRTWSVIEEWAKAV